MNIIKKRLIRRVADYENVVVNGDDWNEIFHALNIAADELINEDKEKYMLPLVEEKVQKNIEEYGKETVIDRAKRGVINDLARLLTSNDDYFVKELQSNKSLFDKLVSNCKVDEPKEKIEAVAHQVVFDTYEIHARIRCTKRFIADCVLKVLGA